MRPERLLIVEADPEVSEDLARRLESLGYGVAGQVRSGQEALDRLEQLAPHAVLLDLELPGTPDAVETCLAIRRLRSLPVLFLKPLEEEEPGAREALASPDACLRKPFCDREIRAVLELVLAEDRNFFGEVVENSGAQVFVKDLEGRYLFVNREWELVSGVSREETLGRTDEELFTALNSAEFRRNDLRAMAEGRVLEFEETMKTPKGVRHFLSLKFPHRDGTGRVAGVCGLATEITALKHAELELRKALERADLFRSILDVTPVHVFLKDRELRYTYANRNTLELFGCTREELIGRRDRDFFAPGTAEFLEEVDRGILAGGRVAHEVSLVTRKGEERIYWEVKNPLYRAESPDEPWGLMGLSSDITESRLAEEERNRLRERLEQAVKMESIGRLAGGVAHDFNNMLGVILGQAEMAQAELEQGQLPRTRLQEIRSAAERSASLTRQLLAFARKQTVHPKVLDLNQTVGTMLGILKRLLGEDLELQWHPSPENWTVSMDPSQVDQVLANLCVNARDAIVGKGRVVLETANLRPDEGKAWRGPDAPPGEVVMLVVRDDGCGMDAETLAHIFEPFFTTKGVAEGTGLGLSTVYGIVRQNGGSIHVESVPGLGTTFRILLPRHEGALEAPGTEPPSPGPSSSGRGTILLVEDEPALQKMTRSMLEHLGYSVLSAGHPSEALRIATERGPGLALLLTDVVMPGMTGLELAETLKSFCPGVPQVFMSGYPADVLAQHGVLGDGLRFLPKPFSMQELETVVREALGEG